MKSNIYGIIAEHVKLKRFSRMLYRGKCPFCHNDENSFIVNVGSRRFNCEKCTRNGLTEDFINLMKWVNDKKPSFKNQPSIRYW